MKNSFINPFPFYKYIWCHICTRHSAGFWHLPSVEIIGSKQINIVWRLVSVRVPVGRVTDREVREELKSGR